MHHSTTVGPVLDENDKPVPGVSFHVKGLLESNHAGELLSQDQFDALVVDAIDLTRTAGGGFEYSMELVVSEQKLAAVLAAKPKPEAPVKPATDEDRAAAYFVSKGYSETDAKALVAKFGAARVLNMANVEADEQLRNLLTQTPPPKETPKSSAALDEAIQKAQTGK